MKIEIEFPSPLGVLSFQISTERKYRKIIQTGFRPLSGSYLSKCELGTTYKYVKEKFPSPLEVLSFQI